MLSNVELIILSLINEKASYPYELEKQIETRVMRLWVKIGITSIYQVLERLNRKKLVMFKIERAGKAPERKRYFITEEGKDELKASAKKLLAKMDWYYLDLNVAIEASDLLAPEEVLAGLKQRLHLVRQTMQKVRVLQAEDIYKTVKSNTIISNVIAFRETEEQVLVRLIDKLTDDLAPG